MSERTKIAWCDSTLNPWSGCTKVSAGCANCYAETLSNRRLGLAGGTLGKWGPGAPRHLHDSAFHMARRLNRKPWVCNDCLHAYADRNAVCCPDHSPYHKHRRRIFSLSLGDWLDPEVPIGWLAEWLDTIRMCADVRWLLLTKRPELWLPTMETCLRYIEVNDCKWPHNGCSNLGLRNWLADWAVLRKPPSHVMIGASVEDQQAAGERIPQLLDIPAVGRFLSMEPLLGPVELNIPGSTDVAFPSDFGGWPQAKKDEWFRGMAKATQIARTSTVRPDWLIIGGESGQRSRPCNVEWIRSLVRQGKDAGVPVFVKQLGDVAIDRNDRGFEGDSGPSGWPMDTDTEDYVEPGTYQGKPVRVRLRASKGGDPAEWPEDLRVREFPEAQN